MRTCWIARGVVRTYAGEYIPMFTRGIAVEFNGMTTIDSADGNLHPLVRNASATFLRSLEDRGWLRWDEPMGSVYNEY
jgi:hypothetical protein